MIDYQIWSDQGTGVWVVLASHLTTRSYTATGLYAGTEYTFKAKSRNSVGYSELSDPVVITAAKVPDQPTAPTTAILDRWSVVIDWVAPYDGGAQILYYTIEIRTADATVFE